MLRVAARFADPAASETSTCTAADGRGEVRLRFIGAKPFAGRADAPIGGGAHAVGNRYAPDVYRDVDLHVYPVAGGVEYDLIAWPGSEPGEIAFEVEGADVVRLLDDGTLLTIAGAHAIRHAAPIAYQWRDGRRESVAAAYRLGAQRRVDFALGDYDRQRPLVIDPFIAVSRVFGGDGTDRIDDLRMGANGKLYAYGTIASTNLSGLDSAHYVNAGQDRAFVARLDPTTLAIEYLVPVGGPARGGAYVGASLDLPRVQGFAVGADGTAYVAAFGSASATSGTPEEAATATGALYIYRIDGSGTVERHAGPLDPAIRTIRALAVDDEGQVAFTGRATSALVTTPGAAVPGSMLAAATAPDRRVGPYVVKLAATGSDVLASTFLAVPGSRPAHPDPEVCRRPVAAPDTSGYAITVAGDGSLLVAGQAAPADLAATAGAVNSSDIAFRDAFVAKIDASGTAIGFVARFGGLDNDRATSIALAPDGSIVVAGKSLRSTWKYAVPGFQTSVSYARLWTNFCEGAVPPEEGFLVTLSADGAQMLSHTTIGATGGDLDGLSPTGKAEMPLRVAVDGSGAVRVAGTTESGRTLPTRNPVVPDSALELYNGVNTRAFLLKALADGTLDYGTRFGARGGDAVATGIGADADGNVYVAGYGTGAGFPVVNTAGLQRRDTAAFAFVTRISEAPAALHLVAAPPAALAGDATTLTAHFGDALHVAAVEFRDGDRSIGTRALVAGQATLSVVLPVGVHALSAILRGGGPWDGLTTAPAYVRIEQSSAAP